MIGALFLAIPRTSLVISAYEREVVRYTQLITLDGDGNVSTDFYFAVHNAESRYIIVLEKNEIVTVLRHRQVAVKISGQAFLIVQTWSHLFYTL